MAQVVEHLPDKCEALSSNSSISGEKKKTVPGDILLLPAWMTRNHILLSCVFSVDPSTQEEKAQEMGKKVIREREGGEKSTQIFLDDHMNKGRPSLSEWLPGGLEGLSQCLFVQLDFVSTSTIHQQSPLTLPFSSLPLSFSVHRRQLSLSLGAKATKEVSVCETHGEAVSLTRLPTCTWTPW
jgi:hypothetical protein